jgi:hypothetical protein
VPRTRSSGSYQRTAGTGTALRAATCLITSNWVAVTAKDRYKY